MACGESRKFLKIVYSYIWDGAFIRAGNYAHFCAFVYICGCDRDFRSDGIKGHRQSA